MHIIFSVQDVEFRFEISSVTRLGQIAELLSEFAHDIDRTNRELEAAGVDPKIPRDLIHNGLVRQADLITLQGLVLKSRLPEVVSTHLLGWDKDRRVYVAYHRGFTD